jgi:serine/threonine protein kinase
MQGGSLADRLKYRRVKSDHGINIPLPSPGEVVEMLERVADALDGLHSEDMVHGQVEPRNIMFDEHGLAYLADIGLTRLLKIIYSLDATNSFNTNKYTAPELWDGQRPLPATDQYSLACIAYELITGRPPFDAPTIFGLMKQHTDDVVLPPHYVRDGIPADLALPFWQAMAKPPERRYHNIYAFVEEVRQAVADKEGSPTGFFTFDMQPSSND